MKKTAIIGSGTMGNGIAQVIATAGYKVILVDLEEELIERGIETIKKNLDRAFKKDKIAKRIKHFSLCSRSNISDIADPYMESDEKYLHILKQIENFSYRIIQKWQNFLSNSWMKKQWIYLKTWFKQD